MAQQVAPSVLDETRTTPFEHLQVAPDGNRINGEDGSKFACGHPIDEGEVDVVVIGLMLPQDMVLRLS